MIAVCYARKMLYRQAFSGIYGLKRSRMLVFHFASAASRTAAALAQRLKQRFQIIRI
jgi:hypothetical protein